MWIVIGAERFPPVLVRVDMTALPLNHFRYLKRLADLRRVNISDALSFLMGEVERSEENWIDLRWPGVEGTRDVDLAGWDRDAGDAAEGQPGLHGLLAKITR